MNPYEKIAEGMRLIVEGCEKLVTCCDCPFKALCGVDVQPTEWANFQKHEEEVEDCDWGYNEDCGFDPYLGCYTDDC